MKSNALLRSFGWLSPLCFVLLHGCATSRTAKPTATPKAPAATSTPLVHVARTLLVWIPMTDAGAISAIKTFDTHPKLRLVLAVSPRFKHLAQDPMLHQKLVALQKAGRLELALQLPNAPFLPLLVDTNSGKEALPSGAVLPAPAFAYPDDVIQMVASAKAEFYRQWHFLPKGLTLPFGAASPALLELFDKQGFAWLIAALEAPATEGSYKIGSYYVWDATPAGKLGATVTRVWDERTMKDRTLLHAWIQDVDQSSTAILPTDPQPTPASPLASVHWISRTWSTRSWSPWVGSAPKNAAWSSLHRAREKLEGYKNSGQASIRKLDLAFEEIYTAENSNYLTVMGNSVLPPATVEERTREFQACLATVYRIIGQGSPEELFAPAAPVENVQVRASSSSLISETLPDGTEHIAIDDPLGDDHGSGALPEPPGKLPAGSFDLSRFEVTTGTDDVKFAVTLANMPVGLGQPGRLGPLIDIYIDLNHEPNIGTLPLLPGRRLNAATADAWEYAISLSNNHAVVYRTQGSDSSEKTGAYPASIRGNEVEFSIPRTVLRGSPKNWGFQLLVMALDPKSSAENPLPYISVKEGEKTPPVYDLLDPSSQTQAALLADIAAGKQQDIPFVRPRAAL